MADIPICSLETSVEHILTEVIALIISLQDTNVGVKIRTEMIQQWSMPYARTQSVLWSMKQWLDWSMTRLGCNISRLHKLPGKWNFLSARHGNKDANKSTCLCHWLFADPSKMCNSFNDRKNALYSTLSQHTTHVIRAIHKKNKKCLHLQTPS